ncbi:recombinase family protein [Methylobacterium radiodurans]|uniref:recombinase family protein n=1 Tax=Methylobacterium radiodurans TaxID=2202828 RepID=UPI001FE2F1AE|nr:recombinase family protein [Methylobacterium radiodurans]
MNFVSYLSAEARESTGPSLAMAAQRAAIATHLSECGGHLIAEVREIRRADAYGSRPALRRALALCRQHGAVLLVPGLDQLTRDPAFLTDLRRDLTRLGVLLAVTRTPEANESTIGILAALEAYAVPNENSERALRRRDFLARLGGRKRQAHEEPSDDRVRPDPVCRPRTMERALSVAPVLAEIRAAGATTFEQVAHALNELGVPSARGDRWYPAQVRRVEQRIASAT